MLTNSQGLLLFDAKRFFEAVFSICLLLSVMCFYTRDGWIDPKLSILLNPRFYFKDHFYNQSDKSLKCIGFFFSDQYPFVFYHRVELSVQCSTVMNTLVHVGKVFAFLLLLLCCVLLSPKLHPVKSVT